MIEQINWKNVSGTRQGNALSLQEFILANLQPVTKYSIDVFKPTTNKHKFKCYVSF